MQALERRNAGKVDEATDALLALLRIEPRLAEPRLELGAIHLETGRLEEAEAEAREAIRILDAGGAWTEDLPENVLLGMGWALLGEVLKQMASTDEVVFGEDPTRFRELIAQSQVAFRRAAELDPQDLASLTSAAELADDGEGEGEPEH
jgi:tetratricopeptide (TPR) repeat protein